MELSLVADRRWLGNEAVEYDPVANEIISIGYNGFHVINLDTRVTTPIVSAPADGWPS